MKFLPRELEAPNLLPLNFIYDRGEGFGNDSLTIIFKNADTGQKCSHTIHKPKIEIYIVKPEFRVNEGLTRHWYPIEKCDKYTVPYASRFYEAAKILGLRNAEDARLNPNLYGADIEIENWYLIQFIKEYPCDASKRNVTVSMFDIENDTIRLDRFPEYGETPINAVTFIDGESRSAYTLVLAKSDVPVVPKAHPMYNQYEEYRQHLHDELEDVQAHVGDMIADFHATFDEIYGEFDYYLAFFDDEIKLIQAFWEIAHEVNSDFVYAWNIPYDMQNMMIRPGVLGYDVNEIICDHAVVKDVANAKVYFNEDRNPKVQKRKHKCVTWTLSTFLDQMVVYAGIRSGRGELASTKLNFIAQKELNDEKLDYSEDGDIKTLFYRNLKKFIKYNLKDVLLQYGIEKGTNDIATIYSRLYELFVMPEQSFITTKVVLHALYSFALGQGYILGQNRNKGHKNNPIVNYGKVFAGVDDEMDEAEYFDAVFGSEEDDESEEESEKKEKIREKYDGAYVMNPLYMNPTGTFVRGKPAKYLHDDVVDFDVTSEYPSAIIIGNISSETLVGKVFLEGELAQVPIPIPSAYEFRGNEAVKYKCDPSNFLLESFSERDYLSFGTEFLGLPTVTEVFAMIDSGEI